LGLLIRGKARDLYDLWFLMEQGRSLDLALINSKLALYETSFEFGLFQRRPLLTQIPRLACVRERVLEAFAKTALE